MRRIGIVFSGGPAPAANAVISALALSFLDIGARVIGFYDGWEHLVKYSSNHPLLEGKHYNFLERDDVSHIRNEGAVILRTTRINPGELISIPEDLRDDEKNQPLVSIIEALKSLEIDALITIGGDGTLGSAYYLDRVQREQGLGNISFIHLPKTIDNDYFGIDWTFGFMTAADYLSKEVRNLRADAKTSNSWYILEVMGRKAGWLTYAAGIAGEATTMFSVEDMDDDTSLEKFTEEMVDLMLAREKHNRRYGVICVSEGLADMLPPEELLCDPLGNPLLGSAGVAERLSAMVEIAYYERTGKKIRIRHKQLGYETRCAPPIAFDVLLGTQLGVGAYRALVEEQLSGVMVSVKDQLELCYIPFQELINPETFQTRLRYVEPQSDFHRLTKFLADRKKNT